MPSEPLPMLAPLPGWINAAPAETLESAAFRSGATLAHFGCMTAAADLPQALWRDRVALAAAEVAQEFLAVAKGQVRCVMPCI